MIFTSSGSKRVRAAIDHRQPDVIPIDFGGTFVSGIHVSWIQYG